MHPVREWSVQPQAWLYWVTFPYRPCPSSQGLPSGCRQILRRSHCFRAAAQRDAAIMGAVMHRRGPSGGASSFQSAAHSYEHVILCIVHMSCATVHIRRSQSKAGHRCTLPCLDQMQRVQCK